MNTAMWGFAIFLAVQAVFVAVLMIAARWEEVIEGSAIPIEESAVPVADPGEERAPLPAGKPRGEDSAAA